MAENPRKLRCRVVAPRPVHGRVLPRARTSSSASLGGDEAHRPVPLVRRAALGAYVVYALASWYPHAGRRPSAGPSSPYIVGRVRNRGHRGGHRRSRQPGLARLLSARGGGPPCAAAASTASPSPPSTRPALGLILIGPADPAGHRPSDRDPVERRPRRTARSYLFQMRGALTRANREWRRRTYSSARRLWANESIRAEQERALDRVRARRGGVPAAARARARTACSSSRRRGASVFERRLRGEVGETATALVGHRLPRAGAAPETAASWRSDTRTGTGTRPRRPPSRTRVRTNEGRRCSQPARRHGGFEGARPSLPPSATSPASGRWRRPARPRRAAWPPSTRSPTALNQSLTVDDTFRVRRRRRAGWSAFDRVTAALLDEGGQEVEVGGGGARAPGRSRLAAHWRSSGAQAADALERVRRRGGSRARAAPARRLRRVGGGHPAPTLPRAPRRHPEPGA